MLEVLALVYYCSASYGKQCTLKHWTRRAAYAGKCNEGIKIIYRQVNTEFEIITVCQVTYSEFVKHKSKYDVMSPLPIHTPDPSM
jgi:hypothetical protein